MYLTFSSIKSSITLFLFWNASLANISGSWVVAHVRKATNQIILIEKFTLENLWWPFQYLKEEQWLIFWLTLSGRFYEYISEIPSYQGSDWIYGYFVGTAVWSTTGTVCFPPTDLLSLQATWELSHSVRLCLPFHTAHIPKTLNAVICQLRSLTSSPVISQSEICSL